MLMDLVVLVGGAAGGAVWSAWRLKGARTWREAVVTVLGGPRPTVPK